MICEKTNRDKVVFWCINLMWFLIVFMLTAINDYKPDDLKTLYYYHTDIPIENGIVNFFSGANRYYMVGGGRYFMYILNALLVKVSYYVFAVLNAMVYLACANVVLQYAKALNIRHKVFSENSFLFLIYLLMWFLTPSFGEITWCGGALTGMWMDLIILFFLFYYWDYYRRNSYAKYEVKTSVRLCVGFSMLGLLAGNSNEGGACMTTAMLLLFVFWALKSRVKIPTHYVLGIVTQIIGMLTLMLAPGNFARAEGVASVNTQVHSLVFRIARGIYYGVRYDIVVVMIAVVFASVFFTKTDGAKMMIKKYGWFFSILVAGTLSWMALCFSPAYSLRCAMLPFLVYLVAAAQAILGGVEHLVQSLSDEGCALLKRAMKVLFLMALFLILLEVATGMYDHFIEGTGFDRKMIYWFEYQENLL